MPPVLASRVVREHAQDMLRLETSELKRLAKIYEQARRELLGALAEVRDDTFTAQQYRGALAQVEAAIRAMKSRIDEQFDALSVEVLDRSIEAQLAHIASFEPRFRGAVSRIQFEVVRKLADERPLLLHQFRTSTARYGLEMVGDVQRRLAVHMVKKSTWREMSIDIAGRLHENAIAGARWKAERIVRTELWNTIQAGHQATLEASAADIPDLKRQWDSTLDARTSEGCRELEGQVRGVDEPFVWSGGSIMRPPRHPNCRSTVLGWTARWAAAEREAA